jgi:hypothetical protein
MKVINVSRINVNIKYYSSPLFYTGITSKNNKYVKVDV